MFITAFSFPRLYNIAMVAFLLLLFLLLADLFILFVNRKGISASRQSHHKLSNGDENDIAISLQSHYAFPVRVLVIDEIPVQFQYRGFRVHRRLAAGEGVKFKYTLRPVSRGEFHFGKINVLVKSPLGLAERKYAFGEQQMLPCYPSFLKLRQYELMAISDRLTDIGIKKTRRLGHSTEFDNIKEYVLGNDIRSINWKATARRSQLMVNHYRDERAQQVYCVIDMGRVMKMPFDALSLLDYSINASLVLSHISYIKHDKPGLIGFSNQVYSQVSADRKGNQLYRIQEALYNAKTDFYETNYEVLVNYVRTRVTQRSLLLLFTNFETINALRRQLKYIRQLAKNHLVVVIIFENTELDALLNERPKDTSGIYTQAIAKKFDYEKRQVALELQKVGVQCVYTKPAQLTVNTLNKYLELKARGMI